VFQQRKLAVLSAALGLLALAGCDGGGGGTSSGSGGGVVASPSPTPTPVAFTDGDAARLAKQASFGATPDLIARIKTLGATAWVDEQLAASTSTYADLTTEVRRDFCVSTDTICNRAHFSRTPVAMRFYADAIAGSDQLRQRTAFAIGQMVVASETEVNSTAGIATFNQILLANAFGNYRDILAQVTMSGYMGDYLDMADSNKSGPSENYARELLQLFSMGPDALNMDGSLKRDGNGGAIPNYTTDDIKGVAKALTGWTYARVGGAAITDGNARDYSKPMIQVASRYDTTQKSFLGTSVGAGATQDASVAAVVDAAFNNPSTAPFVARHMIVHLVTANPSAAYIGRIAAVFADNGKGVRGDMKAVVRAILLDSEARSAPTSTSGKLKEPVLLMTALARAIGFATDGYVFQTRDGNLGQPVFRSPSVFNFYPDDFPLPGSATLKSPASKLLNTSNVLRWHNFVYDWTISGDATRSEYALDSGLPMSSLTQPLWASWEAYGSDLDAMVSRIDLTLFANTLNQAQKDALKAAATPITNTDANIQARKRAQMMLYVAASSPMFLVDR
jgi:uncharacterized protein (DUF1800 family)